jgi:hypothetical protein
MATRLLAPALALLTLTIGCGGEDGEAKQAGMAPASEVAEAPIDSAAAPTATSAPAAHDSAAPAMAQPAGAGATEAQPEEDTSLGRESFSYTGGARDPFQSLLLSSRVGPELPDLTLVAIYYDTRNPGNSVIVMREKISAKRYKLRPGDRIGRIRVSSVRPKDVTFTIDDFGTERQETLSLRKQEDTP